MQKGDVFRTYGDNNKLKKDFKYYKFITIEKGVKHFIDWYNKYYSK